MEIKSRAGDTKQVDVLTITISPRDVSKIVEILQGITKRAKADRLEEYIINELIYALEHPEVKMVEDKRVIIPEVPVMRDTTGQPPASHQPSTSAIIDKVEIIGQVKMRLDPRNEKKLDQFISETITFGRQNFSIKTMPKAETAEGLYDWLVENQVINADGSPNPLFGKK